MSGHKRSRVVLMERDLGRLRQADERLRKAPVDIQSNERIQVHHLRNLWHTVSEFKDRQQSFQQAVQTLDQGLQMVEEQSSQALEQQVAALYDQVETMGATLQQDIAGRLAAQTHFLDSVLSQEQAIQQRDLQQVLQDLRHRDQQQARRRYDLVAQTLQDAGSIWAMLAQSYDHQRYAPGEMERLHASLAQAAENLQAGMSEAALVGAQQTYQALSGLRLRLEGAILKGRLAQAAVLEQIQALYETACNSRQIPALDLDGEPLETVVEVDYWTHGELERLIQKLGALRKNLEQAGEQVDLVDLDRILQKTLPTWEQTLGEILRKARLEILFSQTRVEITERAVQALEQQGFSLWEAGYEQEDMRQAYQACLCSLDGSQVRVRVSSIPEEAGTTQGAHFLELESSEPEQRSEHELYQRAQEVRRSLQGQGLQVGPLNTLDLSRTTHAASEGQTYPDQAPQLVQQKQFYRGESRRSLE